MTGFYLDDSGTMQPLPFLSGGTAVDIRAISGDGSTMAGGRQQRGRLECRDLERGDTELKRPSAPSAASLQLCPTG